MPDIIWKMIEVVEQNPDGSAILVYRSVCAQCDGKGEIEGIGNRIIRCDCLDAMGTAHFPVKNASKKKPATQRPPLDGG